MNNKKLPVSFICGIIAVIASAAALPIRTLIYLNNTEPNTGFYTAVDYKIYLFFAIIGIAALAILVVSFFSRKKAVLDMSAGKKPACAALSILCAGAFGYNAYTELNVDYGYATQFIVTKNIPAFLVYGIVLTAALSTLYFIVMAIAFASGKSCGQAYKILSLTPVLWSILRLTVRFTRTVSYLRVSDIMLEMLMLVCFSVFFMSFAQVNSQVNGEGLEWKITFFGSMSTVLGLICFIPRCILTLTGKGSFMYVLSAAEPCDIAVALFALATVFTRMTSPEKVKKSKENTAEEIASEEVVE